MAAPFTIRIFVPGGDPDGVRVIDRMNWTGKGVTFPRDAWDKAQAREELQQAGVYILIGRDDSEEEDLPLIYIGQTDNLLKRIGQHDKDKDKDFWDRAIVFVSTNGGLNRAHTTWLEWALIEQAENVKQSRLNNGQRPSKPTLPEFEEADTKNFLEEIYRILPVIGVTAFETPKIVRPSQTIPHVPDTNDTTASLDTIIVPAKKDGFERVFIGENAWYAVRIAGGKIGKLKYIAAYQTRPASQVTHWAEIDRIEPYGDAGKYKLIFKEPAKAFDKPIPLGTAKPGSMQSSRYALFDALKAAATLGDVLS